MSDEQDRDVEHWLRQHAQQFEAQHAPQDLVAGLLTAADTIVALRTEVTKWADHAKLAIWSDSEECRFLAADNDRLRIENIQMQAALGYGIPAEDERHILPKNPYKCGTCDARNKLQNIGQDEKPSEVSSRRAVLVERMARVLADGQGEHQEGVWRFYAEDASAALDLALEEAARVADENGAGLAANRIRALKGKP